jgi:choline-sulfatase
MTKIMVLVLASALVVVAWYMSHRNDSEASPDQPSIILISIDTCRADHLGCYNSDWTTTPNIDAFAEGATLFTDAAAPAPLTLPSHTSMLTGQIPLAHGVHDNGQIVPAENLMLAEILGSEGYTAAAYVSTAVMARKFALDQGFDVFDDNMEVDGEMQPERTADQTAGRAIDWLRQREPGKPFFLFVHFFDPHLPYTPPEPFASAAQSPYAGEIAFVDAQIGRLLEALKAEGIYDSSVVIITGDHGEMLGEHGEAEHGFYIYESAIKVPLILKHPGQRAGRRVESIAGLVDIVPTICSLVDVASPTDIAGKDISDRPGGEASDPSRSYYIQSPCSQIIFDTNPLLGLVESRWKFIYTTNPELYDLQADPGEQRNLIDSEPRQARAMQDELEAIVAGVAVRLSATPSGGDAETRQMLESLGYVGSGQRQAGLEIDPSKPDPKDMVGAYVTFNDVMVLMDLGQLDEAIEKATELADAHPDVRVVQWALVRALVRAGRYEEAQRPCERLENLSPDDVGMLTMKGVIAGRLGQYERARAALQRAIELDPAAIKAQRELGDVRMFLGEYEDAEKSYVATLALDANNLKALNNLACLYVDHLGQPAKALPLTQRALSLRPDVPILKDTAGWALARVGRYDEAHALLVEAATAFSIPETRYHLGWTLEKLGRPADARREYETARDLFEEDHDDPLYSTVIEALARVGP